MRSQTRSPRRLAFGLLIVLFILPGCSSAEVEEPSSAQVEEADIETDNTDETGVVEDLDQSSAETQIQFEVISAQVLCSGEEILAILSGTNLGDEPLSYNSMDYESGSLPIEAILRNSNGRGFWDDAWHLSDGEIAPGDSGDILVLFGTLMGFDGIYSLLDVQREGQTVFEQDVEISGDFCN